MISAQFLHDVAGYVDGRIHKVVLNENYEITDFEVKQVDGSTAVLNYIVEASEVSLITKIELKDASDNVISSNDVNVPVQADILMLQTIEAKEAV